MRGRVNAIRTFKGLVADLRYTYKCRPAYLIIIRKKVSNIGNTIHTIGDTCAKLLLFFVSLKERRIGTMVGIARAKEYVITFSVINHESPLLLINWNKDANTPSHPMNTV